jgi:hypothetical protein
MQVDCFKEESLTFKITNTDGDDAITTFNSILTKCKKVAEKKGFNNMFTSEEKAFIREFTDKIIADEAGY